MTLPRQNMPLTPYEGTRSYNVTLYKHDDLDSFYLEMENEGGNGFIPQRAVPCVNRMPISRNTAYDLTFDEAYALCDDPRVLAVELTMEEMGVTWQTCGWTSTDIFTRDSTDKADHSDVNWGKLRARLLANLPNWNNIGGVLTNPYTVINDCSGKNVDIIIIDQTAPVPSSLEFRENPDGTGPTRRVDYNWEQWKNLVSGHSPDTATTDYNTLANNYHGAHCTGIAAGNTQGWATDANIYNMVSGAPGNEWQFIKMFHLNKPVNPVTGVKNPTVVSCSMTMGGATPASFALRYGIRINYRGTFYTPASGDPLTGTAVWDPDVLHQVKAQSGGYIGTSSDYLTADVLDAAAAGVITVSSAGNDGTYLDTYDGLDYNNYIEFSTDGGVTSYARYYARGSAPGNISSTDTSDNDVICVGNLGCDVYLGVSDLRANSSNYGPRVDIFAPGQPIVSIDTQPSYDTPYVDPRVAILNDWDSTYNKFSKHGGTSMACPQIAGIIACLLEKYPRMTNSDVRRWIKNVSPQTLRSSYNQYFYGYDSGFDYNPKSCNQIIYLPNTRAKDASIGGYYNTPFPNNHRSYRNTSGSVFPRANNSRSSGRYDATFLLSTSTLTLANNNSVTVTLTTTNLPNGAKVPFAISGRRRDVVTYDFNPSLLNLISLDGIFTVNNNTATFSFTIKTSNQYLVDFKILISSTGVQNYLRFTVN